MASVVKAIESVVKSKASFVRAFVVLREIAQNAAEFAEEHGDREEMIYWDRVAIAMEEAEKEVAP